MDRDADWVWLRDPTASWSTPLQCGRRLKADLQTTLGQELHHSVDWWDRESWRTHSASWSTHFDSAAWNLLEWDSRISTRGPYHLTSAKFPGSRRYSKPRWPPRPAVGVQESLVPDYPEAFHPHPGWRSLKDLPTHTQLGVLQVLKSRLFDCVHSGPLAAHFATTPPALSLAGYAAWCV